MPTQRSSGEHPEAFERALSSIRAVSYRPEIVVEEAPAPKRLATHAAALEAEVGLEEDLGHGRLVVLHEPDGHEAWGGAFRLVLFAKATLEPEMAADDMLADVGWSWLEEALDHHGAIYSAISGTVTRTTSESYGTIADRPLEGQIEIRASWTAATDDLGPHVAAWADVMAQAAGLHPIVKGVTALPRSRA